MQRTQTLPAILAALSVCFISANRASAQDSPSTPSHFVAPLAAASGKNNVSEAEAASMVAIRAELARQLDQNIQSLERSMASARVAARHLDVASRTEFKRVSHEASLLAKTLHRSLIVAQNARTPEEWDEARSTLAADYENFAQSVAQAERIAATGAIGPSPALSYRQD